MISKLINAICWKIVHTFPSRHRFVHIAGRPYLLRFYVKHGGLLPGIYLHHFFMGDQDRELHDHPWRLSGSLILTGGYVEERLSPRTREVETRHRGPGSINIIKGADFHRVDLVGNRAWTIFISGKKTKGWGFLDSETGEIIPHRRYLMEKGRA